MVSVTSPQNDHGTGTGISALRVPNNAHPKWWKDPGLRKLAPVMAMGTCCHLSVLRLSLISGYCSTVNLGYDGSLIGGLFALPDFLAMLSVDGPLDANRIGLVGSSLLLGTLVAYPFSPLIADRSVAMTVTY